MQILLFFTLGILLFILGRLYKLIRKVDNDLDKMIIEVSQLLEINNDLYKLVYNQLPVDDEDGEAPDYNDKRLVSYNDKKANTPTHKKGFFSRFMSHSTKNDTF